MRDFEKNEFLLKKSYLELYNDLQKEVKKMHVDV